MILYQSNNKRYCKRKLNKQKGNTLIEAIAAISIIVVASDILFTSILFTNKCKMLSIENEEANRIIHCLQNEIKYNYTMEEVVNLLRDRPLRLKRNNILKELRNRRLEELEQGEDIIITIENNNGSNISFRIKYYFIGEDGKNIEKVYKKSEWMEKE